MSISMSRKSSWLAIALVICMVASSFVVMSGDLAGDRSSNTEASPGTRAVSLGFQGFPLSPSVGEYVGFVLCALDQNGAVSRSYRGTVGFWSTDTEATVPSPYKFVKADAGQHIFPDGSVIFMTPGSHVLSAYDIADPSIRGNVTVSVVDTRITLLNESFDSWDSMDSHWTVWNCSNPVYNNIDVADGVMRMTNIDEPDVKDEYNAMANWTYPITYETNLTISFKIYLPYDDDYKYGSWGQFVAICLYDSAGTQRLYARFFMDDWYGAPSGFHYANENSAWGSIARFDAGWHNCSISLLKGSSTWVASLDGGYHRGLTYSNSVWNASDLSKIVLINGLREEPVTAMIDDFKVERVGPPLADLPVASFTYTVDAATVYVNASESSAPAGIADYSWDWGDGTVPDVTTSPIMSHTYGVPSGTVPAPPDGGGPPSFPYTVFGYTYDSNGILLYGCTVTISNKRTGEYLTTTSDDQYGLYMVDVGYVGWLYGDVLEVTAVKYPMFGSNWVILDYDQAYLWIDLTLEMPGPRLITLTVTDMLGQKGITSHEVIVQPPPLPNKPPVADFVVLPAYIGNAETLFCFNGSLSYDNEDPISALMFRWDWEGDGVWDTEWMNCWQSDHVYGVGGEFNPIMEVKDTGGLTALANKTVFVDAYAPFCYAGPDQVSFGGWNVSLTAQGSFDAETSISTFEWRYSDSLGEHVFYGGDVVCEFNAYEPMRIPVLLTATDVAGNKAYDSCVVTVWPYEVMVYMESSHVQKPPITWTLPSPGDGYWTIYIENKGLRSMDVEVYEMSNASPAALVLGYFVKFLSADAYPLGTVYLPAIIMHRDCAYQIVATPHGSAGSYAYFKNMYSSTNQGPFAQMSVMKSGLTIHVSASGSYDPEGDQLKYVWDWDDGSRSYGETATHSYASYGTYTITLVVIDDWDNSALAYEQVTLGPVQPSKVTTIYDMFEQPWGEWYQWRYPGYRTDIVLSNVSGQNTLLYNPDTIGLQGIIYAPYRMNISYSGCHDLSISSPEFMPVRGLSPSGAQATLDVYFEYLDTEWWESYWKPVWNMSDDVMAAQRVDGWYPGVVYSITMNRQAAEAWLGMPQSVADPLWWWVGNGSMYKDEWISWILYEGNERLDIWAGYEWPLQEYGTDMKLSVLPDGRINLQIGSVILGYEILMTRWLGEAGLCSHEPFYEDMSLHVMYYSDMADFAFDAVCQYSLHAVRANESVDGAAWVWEPNAIDYVPSWYTPGGTHPSDYDPFASLTYMSWNAGDPLLGQEVRYENTPTWFDLGDDSRLVFRLPTGDDVIGYLGQPVPYDAIRRIIRYGDYTAYNNITIHGEMSLGHYAVSGYLGGGPDLDSMYDSVTKILTIDGPVVFDNVRHPNGALYHGAPWIEFNVTPGQVGNLPPVAVIGVVSTSGLTLDVDGSDSYDPDGFIMWYSWSWGDGTPPTVPSSEPTASHTYAVSATYWIRLQVFDNEGLDSTTIQAVTVGGTYPPSGEWSDPESIGTGTIYDTCGEVSVDSNSQGDAIAVWSGTYGNGEFWAVFGNRYQPGVGWLGTIYIGPATPYTYSACVGMDENGNITVAWTYDNMIYSVRYSAADNLWEPLVTVSSALQNPTQLTMAVESNGMAVIAWQASDGATYGVYASTRRIGNVWSAPVHIESMAGYAGSPSAAITDGGDAFVAFEVSNGSQVEVCVNRYFAIGNYWLGESDIENLGWYSQFPQVSMDSYGNAFVVWEYCDGYNFMPYANVFRKGFGWSGPVLIDSMTSPMLTFPRVSAYGNCNAVVTWAVSSGDMTLIRTNRYVNGTTWMGAMTIASQSEISFMTSISTDWSGYAYVAWSRSDGTGNVSGYRIEACAYNHSIGWTAPSTVAWVDNTSGPAVIAWLADSAIMVWNEFGSHNDVWASTYGPGVAAPPVASFTFSVVGRTVYVNASGSSAEAGIASCTWYWGDGSDPLVTASPYATHTYPFASNGTYSAEALAACRVIRPPFSVFGYTYASDGVTPLVGCQVTVTNARTLEYATVLSDSAGFYMVDLLAFPSYYADGDVIYVEAVYGNSTGISSGIVDLSVGPYLWLDVVLSGEAHMYTITLVVTDNLGQTSTVSQTVLI